MQMQRAKYPVTTGEKISRYYWNYELHLLGQWLNTAIECGQLEGGSRICHQLAMQLGIAGQKGLLKNGTNPLTITDLNCCQLQRIVTYSFLSVTLFLFTFTNKTLIITDINHIQNNRIKTQLPIQWKGW